MTMLRTTRLLAVVTTAAVLTSGCGVLSSGLRGVPLPGGADLGDDPYTVTVEFPDVVDLVPQSLVTVNDVPVGAVTDISLGPDWTALVTVQVNGDVTLPANSTARVRTTSLLGEKFVELTAADEPEGTLTDGDTIPLERAGRAVEVEEVLGALSMLLNGGGVAQIRTIAFELNRALEGNEPEIRALLDDLDTLVGALDERRDEITRALDEINRLSSTLSDRRDQIDLALTDLEPGLTELENQRGQLVDLLQALDRLSGVATEVIERSREDVLADLELLRPILRNLAASGDDLPASLELFFTPPFTDASIDAFAGDYANLYVRIDLDLSTVLENLARSNQPLIGPDSPLAGLPPTAQLLGPLLGPNPEPVLPELPLLGNDRLLGEGGLLGPGGLIPLPGQIEPTPTRAPEGSTRAPSATPTPTPTRSGGLLGGLIGGGR